MEHEPLEARSTPDPPGRDATALRPPPYVQAHMTRCISKGMFCVAGLVFILQSGCAYFRPEQSESDYWKEQDTIQQQEEFRNSLFGDIMYGAAVSACDGIKSLNGQ